MVAPGRIELPRPCGRVTSTLNVKVIAEKIKSNFDKFRVEFDGGSSMDKDLGSVLGEIFKWYLNKVA